MMIVLYLVRVAHPEAENIVSKRMWFLKVLAVSGLVQLNMMNSIKTKMRIIEIISPSLKQTNLATSTFNKIRRITTVLVVTTKTFNLQSLNFTHMAIE